MNTGLLAQRTERLRGIADHFNSGDHGDPRWVILLIAVVVMAASAYYVWRWQRRLELAPSSRRLLRMLGGRLGLSGRHYRLLRQMARAAGIAPAAALVSPDVLTHMVRCSQRAGLELSAAQSRLVHEIFGAVAAGEKK